MQQEAALAARVQDTALQRGEDRFLVFRIGGQSFATPLLSIREIVEPLNYSAVPCPHAAFLGLANLRGQIVGVLDLGRCLADAPVAGSREAVLLVFDLGGTAMAGLVHSVEAVAEIREAAIDRSCQAPVTIPHAAFGGIARCQGRLIPVVALAHLMAAGLAST